MTYLVSCYKSKHSTPKVITGHYVITLCSEFNQTIEVRYSPSIIFIMNSWFYVSFVYLFMTVYIRIYICMCMPVCMGMCSYMCVCLYAYVHACMHVCKLLCQLAPEVISIFPPHLELLYKWQWYVHIQLLTFHFYFHDNYHHLHLRNKVILVTYLNFHKYKQYVIICKQLCTQVLI